MKNTNPNCLAFGQLCKTCEKKNHIKKKWSNLKKEKYSRYKKKNYIG